MSSIWSQLEIPSVVSVHIQSIRARSSSRNGTARKLHQNITIMQHQQLTSTQHCNIARTFNNHHKYIITITARKLHQNIITITQHQQLTSTQHCNIARTFNTITNTWLGWLGGIMVRASDLRPSGHAFDSQSGRYQVTTLGKLFTPMCLCHQAV